MPPLHRCPRPLSVRAGIAVLGGARFTTEASTDDVARRADRLQHDLGDGPGVGAADGDSVYVTATSRATTGGRGGGS